MSEINENKQIEEFNEGEQTEYKDENIVRYEAFETEIFEAENAVDSTETMDTNIGNDLNVNGEMEGIHIYGETVSQPIQASNMLDFIADIFVQYQQGNLPKTTPEETAELLRKWFDGSLSKDVNSEFHEQPITPIESSSEQCIRNILKRPRIDSEL
jgi:hypothetical protein